MAAWKWIDVLAANVHPVRLASAQADCTPFKRRQLEIQSGRS
jgi:hypothetical protein